MYSLVIVNDEEIEKAKRVSKNVVKNRRQRMNIKTKRHKIKRIQNK